MRDLTYAFYLVHFPIQLATVLVIDALGFSRDLFLAPWPLAASSWEVSDWPQSSFRVFEMPAQDALRAAWLRRERVMSTTV